MLNPNNFILFCLISISLISFTTNAQSDNYENALQSFSKRDYDTAYIHIKNALKENSDNLPTKLLLAKILIEKHSYQLAEEELTETLQQGADINLIIAPLGKSLLLQAKYETALTFANGETLTKQGKLALNLIKAKAYQGLLNTEKSEGIYQQILNENPTNLTATLGLASLYLSLNNSDKVSPLLKKAELLNENSSKLWQLKGILAKQNSAPQQALVFFKKANELKPNDLVTYRGLANSYFELQQLQQANLFLDKILAISPNDPQTQLMKSSLLHSLNEDSAANKILTELTNQLSSINEAYLHSQPQLLLIDGLTSYRQSHWQQARQKFQAYLETNAADIDTTILLADVYIKLNEDDKALILLEKNERKLLKSKDNALILVGLYFQFNKHFKADYLLSELRKLYKNDESILIASAKLFSETGQVSKALTLMEGKKNANSAAFHHALALLYFQTEQLENSLTRIQLAIASSSENVAFQLLHSQILLRLNKFNEAQQIIIDLYEKHPENNDVLASYALLQASTGKTISAQKVFKHLVTVAPDNGSYWLQLARFENDLGNSKEAIRILEKQSRNIKFQEKALNKLATLYFQAKQFDKSLDAVSRSLKNNRLDVQAIELKFQNLVALGKLADAKHQINILQGLGTTDEYKLLKLSRMLQQVKEFQSADNNLTQALELAPDNITILIDSIKLKIRLNDYKGASYLLNKAKQTQYTGDIRLLILSGDIAFAKNNKQQAFNYYQQALKQDKANTIALVKLAQTSTTPSLSEQFIKQLTALVNEFPHRNFQQHTLADHLMVNKKYNLAKYQYQLLLTKAIPTNKRAVALNNLANIYIIEKDFASAVEFATQALAIVKAEAAIVDTLGWALTLSGEPTKGLPFLRQAYTMSSNSADIQYHIAYTLVQLNRAEEAQSLLKQIMNTPKNSHEYKLAKDLLAKLE